MDVRCPYHDIIFPTETDHTKPGTRQPDEQGKQTGASKHPLYKAGAGGVWGHPDCPLCKREPASKLVHPPAAAA